MNIYNSILTFSNDFKNCDEVKEFKKLKKKIDENPENKKIIDDFHKKLYDYQIAKQNGEDVAEKENQLNELNSILMSNSEISEFMAAEVRISTIMNDVANYVSEYIRSLEQSKESILIEMEEYASINKVPIIEVEVARFLEFLVMLKKPKRILEIGTAIGYSSIIMNRAYPDSIITTIEIDEKNFLKAKEFIKRAGCEKNIDLIYADANDALDFITDEYDMIFMDAAKGQYISFFEKSIERLNHEGILVSDNILFRGLVAKEKNNIRRKNTIVKRLKEFLKIITNSDKFSTTIIPIDDGMAICYKK